MKRFSLYWAEKRTRQGYDGAPWREGWYTDIGFQWFKREEWLCCIAKYDGVPYFLFIFWFVMFRFGKYGHWD